MSAFGLVFFVAVLGGGAWLGGVPLAVSGLIGIGAYMIYLVIPERK